MSSVYPEGTTASDIDALLPSPKDERIDERTYELMDERVHDPEWLSDHFEWMQYRKPQLGKALRPPYFDSEQYNDECKELCEFIAANYDEPSDELLQAIGAALVSSTLDLMERRCREQAESEIESEDYIAAEDAALARAGE